VRGTCLALYDASAIEASPRNSFQLPEVSLMRRCCRLLVFTALALCLGTVRARAGHVVAARQGGRRPGRRAAGRDRRARERRDGVLAQVVTDETGSYSLLQVPPGAYTITAELPGFQTAARKSRCRSTLQPRSI
jgi:hypothetical protein